MYLSKINQFADISPYSSFCWGLELVRHLVLHVAN